ncbi:MAG TPA: hypothetical protein VGE54_00995 [Brevundimonas sp.]
MRRLAAILMAAAVGFVAGPALACSPPPPPNWNYWLGNPEVAMFIGRVESVETLPVETFGGYVITPGRAHVVSLEVIQGAPTVDTAQAEGALSFAATQTAATPPCLNYLNHRAGDLVIVVQPPGQGALVISRSWASLPQLTPYFEKYQ